MRWWNHSIKKQFPNKANGFLNTPVISAIRKHRALTIARYKRSEFRIRGDINVIRLINRTEQGVNLDACVWELPQGYSHLGYAVRASYRTLQNELTNNCCNTMISYVLGRIGNTQLIIRKQTSYMYSWMKIILLQSCLKLLRLKHRRVIRRSSKNANLNEESHGPFRYGRHTT